MNKIKIYKILFLSDKITKEKIYIHKKIFFIKYLLLNSLNILY